MTMQTIELEKFVPVDKRRKDYGDTAVLVDSEPYTIAFCYLPTTSLCVKGLADHVRKFVDMLPPCNYYISYWKDHKHRGFWKLNASANEHFQLMHGMHMSDKIMVDADGHTRYHLIRKGEKWIEVASFRRMPRKCLKELVDLPAAVKGQHKMSMWRAWESMYGVHTHRTREEYNEQFLGSFDNL